MSLAAIMARGPWREFDGDPEVVFDALSDAEDVASDQLSLTGDACGEARVKYPADASAAMVAERRRMTDQSYLMLEHEPPTHAWPSRVAAVLKGMGTAVGDRVRAHSPTPR